MPTCPHPQPQGTSARKCALPTPLFPNFLPLPSHNFLPLAHHSKQEAQGHQHHPWKSPEDPGFPRRGGGGGGGRTPACPRWPALAGLTCRMEVRCSFLCTLEASRLNSRAMRPRWVKSWLWSGSSAHTLRVVSKRCRCSIRLLSSWGRGSSSWQGKGTGTTLHQGLNRCHQPFALCFSIPHDSVSPSDPSSAREILRLRRFPVWG